MRLRGCLARVGVYEGVAGVVDVYGVLVHKGKQEGHQEMRANEMDTKEQRGGLGDTYTRRKWRIMAASARFPTRNGGGLGAWGGARGAGIERGCRRLLIEAEKEGDRGH